MEQFSIEMLASKKKLSLALSGGGFRASFFHLGVLAKLAQLGVLSNIKVISTVSGGSIIGAMYYQELLNRIRLKQGILVKEDYISVVQTVEEKFALGVANNIRGKLFFNPLYEMQALRLGREHLLSKLYNKYFYKTDLKMSDLQDSYGVAPKLIINATSLNNGKHWFFSQGEMGQYDEQCVEGNIINYENTPIKLSDAVAASSAVPGLLNYVNFKSLNVKLIDGGVIDNLGVYALSKENVDFIIISDASRPLLAEDQLQKRRLPILKRAYDASLVFSRRIILDSIPENERLYLSTNDIIEELSDEITSALSKIRTDLNDFHRYESKLLSYYGFKTTEKHFKAYILEKDLFLFEDIVNHLEKQQYILKVLKAGSNLSKTGGELINAKNKDWIEYLEGITELWRVSNNPFVTFSLVVVHIFGIALLQGIVGMLFNNQDKTIQTYWINVLYVFLIASLALNIRKNIGTVIGSKFGNLVDNSVLKLLHAVWVLFLYLNVLFIMAFIFIMAIYLYSLSRILAFFILVVIIIVFIVRYIYKQRTSYRWPSSLKKGK
ncbi:patatin-like phospholipase family protein [Paenibacillus alba]|uniref:patatin-like phospholipase family protein n=1 Tax=Paenibacillus alba TaxID=1197127 RepID=UPI0015666FD7|nr:patatin-like phospholipase family protein [Paenibacillus alba]